MNIEQEADFERRLRIVESLVSKIEYLINLMTNTSNRVDSLEEHDKEILELLHHTYQVQDKDIQGAREGAIKIATEHTNKLHSIAIEQTKDMHRAAIEHSTENHKQTIALLAGQFSLFISAVVGGALFVLSLSNAIVEDHTDAKNITKVVEKLDSKLDIVVKEIQDNTVQDARSK
jgi:hypothetical protein